MAGGVIVASGFIAAATSNQVDYTGSVGLGSIVFAIGVVVAGAFVRHSTGAWKETAEGRLATINEQNVIDTLAAGSSDTSQHILEAIKSATDLVVEHDRRANLNIDRLASLIADREQRFRQSDH
jgi:hypothetical protein